MRTHADHEHSHPARSDSQGANATSQFADQRPAAAGQNRLASLAAVSPRTSQLQAIQTMAAANPGVETTQRLGTGQTATKQRQAAEEEEPLQGKFAGAQRAAAEEDELQMKAVGAPEPAAQLQAEAAPRKNDTGLPDNLKSGVESLSGMSMDSVRVHYNSSKPAQLNAYAYAQGTDIHVGPGHEKHLPHEAWHVVQQAQGLVKPTMQMKGGVPVNDDAGLEEEADLMGERAAVQVAREKPDSRYLATIAMSPTTEERNQTTVRASHNASITSAKPHIFQLTGKRKNESSTAQKNSKKKNTQKKGEINNVNLTFTIDGTTYSILEQNSNGSVYLLHDDNGIEYRLIRNAKGDQLEEKKRNKENNERYDHYSSSEDDDSMTLSSRGKFNKITKKGKIAREHYKKIPLPIAVNNQYELNTRDYRKAFALRYLETKTKISTMNGKAGSLSFHIGNKKGLLITPHKPLNENTPSTTYQKVTKNFDKQTAYNLLQSTQPKTPNEAMFKVITEVSEFGRTMLATHNGREIPYDSTILTDNILYNITNDTPGTNFSTGFRSGEDSIFMGSKSKGGAKTLKNPLNKENETQFNRQMNSFPDNKAKFKERLNTIQSINQTKSESNAPSSWLPKITPEEINAMTKSFTAKINTAAKDKHIDGAAYVKNIRNILTNMNSAIDSIEEHLEEIYDNLEAAKKHIDYDKLDKAYEELLRLYNDTND